VVEANRRLDEILRGWRNVRRVSVEALGRGCYTKHGFHLNEVGKRRVAEVVYSHIHQVCGERWDPVEE